MLKDMPDTKNIAIIVAAGSGSRLGSEVPKQFLRLRGRELLSYSVQTFLDHPHINQVVIVSSESYLEQVKSDYPECQVVLGGASRQDSVFNGLGACPLDTTNVLIHDAARPLIPREVIDNCIKGLEQFDGLAPAIKPVDSMVQTQSQGFQNLDRESLRIVQTPQCFSLGILQQAHASGKIDTDEMGLVKQALPEASLGFIEGAPQMMKVTRSKDLDLLKIYLEDWAG